MKLVLCFIGIIFLCSIMSLNALRSKNQSKVPTAKRFHELYTIDPCKNCMTENRKDESKHFPCPHSDSLKCYPCNKNMNKQNNCDDGCFAKVEENAGTGKHCWKQINPIKVKYEKSPKPAPIIPPVKSEDINIFIIDTSGSMDYSIEGCQYDNSKVNPAETRLKYVKADLLQNIKNMKPGSKYYIWESQKKTVHDNLDGKSNPDPTNYINGLTAGNVFIYSDVFIAIKDALKKVDDTKKVFISLLTDGGVVYEDRNKNLVQQKPTEDNNFKEIMKLGIKKWELILYDKGGCDEQQYRQISKETIDELKKVIKA